MSVFERHVRLLQGGVLPRVGGALQLLGLIGTPAVKMWIKKQTDGELRRCRSLRWTSLEDLLSAATGSGS